MNRKNNIKKIFAVILILIILFSCSCGKNNLVALCVHEWGEPTTIKAATCTEEGEQVSVCAKCGGEFYTVVEKTNHEICQKEEIKDGYKIVYEECSLCGEKLREISKESLTEKGNN